TRSARLPPLDLDRRGARPRRPPRDPSLAGLGKNSLAAGAWRHPRRASWGGRGEGFGLVNSAVSTRRRRFRVLHWWAFERRAGRDPGEELSLDVPRAPGIGGLRSSLSVGRDPALVHSTAERATDSPKSKKFCKREGGLLGSLFAGRHPALEELRREDARPQRKGPAVAPGGEGPVGLEAAEGEFLDPEARVGMLAAPPRPVDAAEEEGFRSLPRSDPPDRRLVGVDRAGLHVA